MSTTAVVNYVYAFSHLETMRLLPGFRGNAQEKELLALLNQWWDRCEDVEQAVIDLFLKGNEMPHVPRCRVSPTKGQDLVRGLSADVIMVDEFQKFSDEDMKKTETLRAGPVTFSKDENGDVTAHQTIVMQKPLEFIPISIDLSKESETPQERPVDPKLKQLIGSFPSKQAVVAVGGLDEETIDALTSKPLEEMSIGAWVKTDECVICKNKPPCPHVPVENGELVIDRFKPTHTSLDAPLPMNVPHYKVMGPGIGNIRAIEKLEFSDRKKFEDVHEIKDLGRREFFVSGKTEMTIDLFPGPCPFEHENIDTLYNVTPCPIEELPKTCTCGRPLTYAVDVVFVQQEPQRSIPGVVEVTSIPTKPEKP